MNDSQTFHNSYGYKNEIFLHFFVDYHVSPLIVSMAKPVYTELSPIEHCLLRPDTYIGAVRPVSREDWLLISHTEDEKKMVYRSFLSNPGMERLFIECQSNAIDNAWRSSEAGIKQTRIEFELQRETGWVSVKNDGLIIPLERHAESGLWNPEFIFGRLRTSSNYDDTEERKTSGKNGLGSKLNNIYSLEFSVEIFDKSTSMMYTQSWSDHMKHKNEAVLTKLK